MISMLIMMDYYSNNNFCYPNGRKQRGTKEPLDEGKRGE